MCSYPKTKIPIFKGNSFTLVKTWGNLSEKYGFLIISYKQHIFVLHDVFFLAHTGRTFNDLLKSFTCSPEKIKTWALICLKCYKCGYRE